MYLYAHIVQLTICLASTHAVQSFTFVCVKKQTQELDRETWLILVISITWGILSRLLNAVIECVPYQTYLLYSILSFNFSSSPATKDWSENVKPSGHSSSTLKQSRQPSYSEFLRSMWLWLFARTTVSYPSFDSHWATNKALASCPP